MYAILCKSIHLLISYLLAVCSPEGARPKGLSEVRIAQQKVLDAQDQFTTVQNKRREVYNLLSEVQLKRKDIHDKLQLSKPGEPRYLKLIMEDHEIIGQENKLKESFIDVEKLERELFTNLTTAVRISHERERLQADKTKYWSIIGSIIGTIIGIIGSSINNSHKLKEIKVMLKEIAAITQVTSDTSVDKLSKIENIVKTTFKENIAKPVMKTFGSQTSFNDSFKSNEQDLKLDRIHMHMIAIAGILTLLMCSCCR
ncbi:coiled-coil domain-containing protein 51-like isoform X2 [Ctenocephalides felis]|uniref:coiled-coil domain-containing protein 51-like isoform X2 n=1 Tax=Ctenocephalides felis TaxID=7515 RepID=UPI000E6E5046|nr:coiled-coil domain-containing protein 51-like isoform X2 [Ctenocephalides felis]